MRLVMLACARSQQGLCCCMMSKRLLTGVMYITLPMQCLLHSSKLNTMSIVVILDYTQYLLCSIDIQIMSIVCIEIYTKIVLKLVLSGPVMAFAP